MLAIRRRAGTAEPGNAELERSLATGLDRVGDIKLRNSNVDGARRAYEESLAIRRRLADAAPERIELQRDLSLSLDRVGNITLRRGDTASALALFEKGLAIARQLAESDPDDPELQRDVALSLDTIGGMQLTANDSRGARERFRKRSKSRASSPSSIPTMPNGRSTSSSASTGWLGRAKDRGRSRRWSRLSASPSELERDGHLSGEEKSIPDDLRDHAGRGAAGFAVSYPLAELRSTP